MKLDNNEQRDLLITIIQNTPISGSYPMVSDTVKKIDRLLKSISEAEIKSEAE